MENEISKKIETVDKSFDLPPVQILQNIPVPTQPPVSQSAIQTQEKVKGFDTESNFLLRIRNYEEQKMFVLKWAEITFECLNEHKDKLKNAHIKIDIDGRISSYYEWKDE